MAGYRRRQWRGFGVKAPVLAGTPAREVLEERRYGEDRGTTTAEVVSFCASCHAAFVEQSDVGGVCVTCGQVLCRKCSGSGCAICGRAVCNERACSGTLRGKKVCRDHTLWELVRFDFTGHR